MIADLQPREVGGGRVEQTAPGRYRLSIPAGAGSVYRCAQLDDYIHLPRRAFPWRDPFRIELRLRVSAPDLPGTWGFGLWNDPFGFSFGTRGRARRLPTLPQAAWFFYASPHNYLSLRDHLPASGFLAATFTSMPIPTALLALALPLAPLLAIPPAARLLRRLARPVVRESAMRIATDVTAWHTYRLSRTRDAVKFSLDGERIAVTTVSPRLPLGFVLWIDNQFAAFPPNGRVRAGSLPTSAAWLEVEIEASKQGYKGSRG